MSKVFFYFLPKNKPSSTSFAEQKYICYKLTFRRGAKENTHKIGG